MKRERAEIVFVRLPGQFSGRMVSGIPSLIGYARSIGLRTAQVDAEIGFGRYLMSDAALVRHAPRQSDSRKIKEYWAALRAELKRRRKYRTSRFGDDLSIAAPYYSARYPDTVFLRQLFFLERYSFNSSSDLKAGAAYLMQRRDHPLTTYFRERVLPEILRHSPRIVGLSFSVSQQSIPGMLLAAMLRREDHSLHIAAGGRFVSRYSDRILEYPGRFFEPIDSFSLGDGEPALDGFKGWLAGECDLTDIDNLLLPGKQLRGPLVFADIRSVPPPEYDPKVLAQYDRPLRVTVEFSRGCYWGKCAFCVNTVGVNRCYRLVDVAHIVRTMRHIKRKYGIDQFYLGTLAANPAHLRKFLVQLKKARMKCSWDMWIRMDRGVTAELLRDAVEAGCDGIDLAPESLCQRSLDLMSKGIKAAYVIDLLDRLKAMGLPFNMNVLAGFPGDDIQALEETFRICHEHGFTICIAGFHLEYASDIHRKPEAYGIKLLKGVNERFDLTNAMAFRVLPGTPFYIWEKVRPKFIEKYREWFASGEENQIMIDFFCFGRRDLSVASKRE